MALNERGDIWIVEIKSSLADLRADSKWEDYRFHCDRLFFAFTRDLPCEIFPPETGLIVADAYGAYMHCEAPEHRLQAATRKAMLLRFASTAAQRLGRLADPDGFLEGSVIPGLTQRRPGMTIIARSRSRGWAPASRAAPRRSSA